MSNCKIGPDQEHFIVQLYRDAGLTATEIALQMKVHLDTVCRALRRAGIEIKRGPRIRITKNQVQKMTTMYSKGMSTTKIADTLGGMDASTVQRHLRQSGVALKDPGFQRGEGHHNWKGGRRVTEDGYVLVLVYPEDPFYPMAQTISDGSRYCLEHRLVMARHLGRLLTEDETVHHVDDRDRQNNHISNLQLRQGNHGKGAAFLCADCGSHNIKAVGLGVS
jgi:hypothetical protein